MYPRTIIKKMIEDKKIAMLGLAQIVTDVQDLNPPDDESDFEEPDPYPVPSMLHHFDKNQMEKFIIEDELEILKDSDDIKQQRFAPKLNESSKFKTQFEVSNAVKKAFEIQFMF